jgi:hypothetical protein
VPAFCSVLLRAEQQKNYDGKRMYRGDPMARKEARGRATAEFVSQESILPRTNPLH